METAGNIILHNIIPQ